MYLYAVDLLISQSRPGSCHPERSEGSFLKTAGGARRRRSCKKEACVAGRRLLSSVFHPIYSSRFESWRISTKASTKTISTKATKVPEMVSVSLTAI